MDDRAVDQGMMRTDYINWHRLVFFLLLGLIIYMMTTRTYERVDYESLYKRLQIISVENVRLRNENKFLRERLKDHTNARLANTPHNN